MSGIGVIGLGMALPRLVRTNQWWTDDVVASWRRPPPPLPPPVDLSPAARDVASAMAAGAPDPFHGVTSRHALAPDEHVIELEVAAAHDALADAGIAPDAIDVVLLHRAPADYQITNIACELHARLHLPSSCLTLQTEGAQHAFLLQLDLARALIASGQARHALLVQSSAMSRIVDPSSPLSPVFGDGATAVVAGPVGANRGVLGSAQFTDGAAATALVATTVGGRWYDDGRSVLQVRDPQAMRDLFLATVDVTTSAIQSACARTGIRPDEVDVFLMHQGTPWLRALVQKHARLEQARTLDTVAETGHLFGACLPSTLVAAKQAGLVDDDRFVLLASGGAGMTYGATLVRWGR